MIGVSVGYNYVIPVVVVVCAELETAVNASKFYVVDLKFKTRHLRRMIQDFNPQCLGHFPQGRGDAGKVGE